MYHGYNKSIVVIVACSLYPQEKKRFWEAPSFKKNQNVEKTVFSIDFQAETNFFNSNYSQWINRGQYFREYNIWNFKGITFPDFLKPITTFKIIHRSEYRVMPLMDKKDTLLDCLSKPQLYKIFVTILKTPSFTQSISTSVSQDFQNLVCTVTVT